MYPDIQFNQRINKSQDIDAGRHGLREREKIYNVNKGINENMVSFFDLFR
jgi:hypothetical protein